MPAVTGLSSLVHGPPSATSKNKAGTSLPKNDAVGRRGGAGDDAIEALNAAPDIIDRGDGTDTVMFNADVDTVTNCEDVSTG